MRVALIGLPGAGVKTMFSAITGHVEAAGAFVGGTGHGRTAVLKVPDPRLELISGVYSPKKNTPATVEFVEFPGLFGQKVDSQLLAKARESEALGLVVRTFPSDSVPHLHGSVDPSRDLEFLRSEMMLSDLAIIEPRLERLEASLKKRKNEDEELERQVLFRCRQALEEGQPIGAVAMSAAESKRIRGFGFLSQKPFIVLLNVGDSQIGSESDLVGPLQAQGLEVRAICADVEAELSRMDEAERDEFMADFGIRELAAPVVVRAAFQILDVVTFYTYGEDECRAWTVSRGDNAVDAAGKIHSDLARGFIRAEVVGFDDFEACGDIKTAKAQGKFRLEGKDYVVTDGDLIIIRHSS